MMIASRLEQCRDPCETVLGNARSSLTICYLHCVGTPPVNTIQLLNFAADRTKTSQLISNKNVWGGTTSGCRLGLGLRRFQ